MLAYVFPGQGSQFKGMGSDLFQSTLYSHDIERQVDEILGYSLKEMCLNGPEEQLQRTEITQPCLFVVNALHYMQYRSDGRKPAYLAGHSLGEYNALHAAGVFDILTGLHLVVRRGQLMADAPSGAMAAVLGIDADDVAQALKTHELTKLDLANFNTPAQVVISGPAEDIQRAEAAMMSVGASGYIQLMVSAPFHSRYMETTSRKFAEFINEIEFKPLEIPVISNVTARPYPMEGGQSTRALLIQQIKSQVRWCPSVGYMKAKGVDEFIEAGPGMTLARMLAQIPAQKIDDGVRVLDSTAGVETAQILPETVDTTRGEAIVRDEAVKLPTEPSVDEHPRVVDCVVPLDEGIVKQKGHTGEEKSAVFNVAPEVLGSDSFRSDYGVRYAHAAGAMYKGIASKEMVVAMGKQRLLSYLGTGGMSLEEIERAIHYIKQALPDGPYGMNLLHQPDDPQTEERMVDCYLKQGIQNVEASAYMSLTPAIVRFRLTGLSAGNGGCIRRHRILAKVSRPEIATLFMRPAPEYLVKRLLESGKITQIQAELACTVPMADDICVEADSGGHTDGGVALALFPAIRLLRDEIVTEYASPLSIRVGAAGGIGTPHAAAAAFIMGADFILTGSINQCTVEAGTSDAAKNLLETIEAQDTAYAPAGDMFEYGAKVQVARKGLFFHTRANMLYELYIRYDSLEEIPAETIKKIEDKFFKRKLSDVWSETKAYYARSGRGDISEIEQHPKKKMALIFKWYFAHSNQLALEGRVDQKVDYQIHCGPALGAFNRWVKGTSFESWRQRHVAEITEHLMKGTAAYISERVQKLRFLT